LELPQDILDKIVCRQTNPSIAQEILAVEDQGKRESLIREIISDNLTREEVRELVRNNRQESNSDFLTNSFVPSKTEKELHDYNDYKAGCQCGLYNLILNACLHDH
jgi:hypothetical protein